jgi:hypothetical protein
MNQNIFSTLFKYCVGSDENYLTDAFAYVLRLLLHRAPQNGITIINQLCGLQQANCFEQPTTITINTQVTVDEGRPDIEVRDHNILVYVEVKHDAPLSEGQLEYYKSKLIDSPHAFTQLVLLTRSRLSAKETTLFHEQYHHIRWYEVHDLLAHAPISDNICRFFVDELLQFLKEKNMVMNKVTWEYIRGVPALLDLTNMLEEAVAEVMNSRKMRRTAGWSWRGFYSEDGFYIGIPYDHPTSITFQNNGGRNPTYIRDLELENAHFFSLAQGEQFECIVSFLRQSLDEAPTSNTTIDLDKLAQSDINIQ